MKQKENPRFRFSGSIDMEIIRRQVKRHRRSVLGQWTIRIVVAAMIVTGTYLVIEIRRIRPLQQRTHIRKIQKTATSISHFQTV